MLLAGCAAGGWGTLVLLAVGVEGVSHYIAPCCFLGVLQVGGGPWWSPWSATADMKEPFRTLVQLPIDLGALSQVVPDPLKPPGL
jgi:hypothetical protein